MRNKFKVGDKVTPVDPNRRTYGHVGTVTESHSWGDVVVKFDHLSAPATFYWTNLRLATNTPMNQNLADGVHNNEDIHIVVYELADSLLLSEEVIFTGDINSAEVKSAIVNSLEGNMDATTIVTMSQDYVDDCLGEAAAGWMYVFGLYNGKPFRIETKSVTEIAE